MRDPDGSVEVRVHEDDDPRIERILDLIDEAARPRPLEEVLGVLCAEVAAIVEAQVASIYVRDEEDEGTLVMRANVGFPGGAIGQVRLAVGEGITGFAAECMRPVTVSTADEDEHFKPVPGLGEEEFPIFLALPILVGRRAEAVLVLQRRRGRSFELPEVVLATALSTSFAYALDRSRAREEGDDEGPRHAQLGGRGRAPGAALGRVETAPTFEGLAAVARARGLAEESDPVVRSERNAEAVAQAARDFTRAFKLVAERLPDAVSAHLSGLFLLWQDQRLRDVVAERSAEEPNPALVFRDVAKVYARAAYESGGGVVDPSTRSRTREVETLGLAATLRCLDLRSPHAGAVLVLTDDCPALSALHAVGNRVAAIAVRGDLAEDDPAVAIATAASIPLVDRVGGLFAWARVGDRALVEADAGLVRVNPSATVVAAFRRAP